MVGQPRYLNPIFCQTSDVDMDLSRILFSGLVKYDKDRNIIPDIAKEFSISEDKKTYIFKLREDVVFHDGERLTADDVVFTIQAIQNPEYKSPISENFEGVKVEKINDFEVKLELAQPYVPFINNLTVGILPCHLWENIEPKSAALAEFNLKPVGSGPYKFSSLKKDKTGQIKSILLEKYENYYASIPYLKSLTFKFYSDADELIRAYNKKEVEGISFLPISKKDEVDKIKNSNLFRIKLPQYFAIFLNQEKSEALKNSNVRKALSYATNRRELIDEALNGEGVISHAPIPEGFIGFSETLEKYNFDPEKARSILDEAGFKDEDGDGIRKKGETKLEFTLLTTDWPEYVKTAELLKKQWKKIGVNLNLRRETVGTITQDYIRPREYEALLYGEIIGSDPDPYPFWHSQEARDPGLNLALFKNEKADNLLVKGRKEFDTEKRAEYYQEFQEILVEELPAIFLYNPIHLYLTTDKLKGLQLEKVVIPSERFGNVNEWYIKTKRVLKNKGNKNE